MTEEASDPIGQLQLNDNRVDGHLVQDQVRTAWFYRDYAGLTGGQVKHSHYFGHVLRMPGFAPKITFRGEPSNESHALERRQLWPAGDEGAAARWEPGRRDVLFLAGVDWRYLTESGLWSLPNPRINLVQHVRHAHEGTELHSYLAHRAIRICVSREVADAISATGRVRGPILTIPNGIDMTPAGPAGEGLAAALVPPAWPLQPPVAQHLPFLQQGQGADHPHPGPVATPRCRPPTGFRLSGDLPECTDSARDGLSGRSGKRRPRRQGASCRLLGAQAVLLGGVRSHALRAQAGRKPVIAVKHVPASG